MGTVEERQPVFVSFATEDERVVRERIYGPLSDAGFEAFMYTEVRDGGAIAPTIRQALEGAGSLVFALSEHSARADRDWLTIELAAFLRKHQLEAVTVVNVGEVPPFQLDNLPVQLEALDILEIEGWFDRARTRLEQPPDRKLAPEAAPPPLADWVTATWPLVDQIADRLPRQFFDYPAPIVDELQSKIKRAGVLILRGSQLSGKSRLLRQLADRFPERLVVEKIRLQDIKAGLQGLFEADRQTAENEFLLPLAGWASYAARYVLAQLGTEERDRVVELPGGPYLLEYADSYRVALEDITSEARKTRDVNNGPNEILAFQKSLSSRLAPVWNYGDAVKPVLLPILLEDFHEYAKLSEGATGTGQTLHAIDFQTFSKRFLERIDYLATAQIQSNRDPEPVYIIVTTRAVEYPDNRAANAYVELEDLTSCIPWEHMAPALNSGPGPWSEDDVGVVVDAAKQAASGHAYLLDRFLRAATALRIANSERGVDEIVKAVQSLPQIWYQKGLFEAGGDLATPRSPGDPTPKIHMAEYTPFLANVSSLANREPQFLEEYRKILERGGGRRGDAAYEKDFLIPLLQLGLVKPDPKGEGCVPSCPIVEKFFSPGSLGTLFGLGS